jgi:hypothetical protein
VREQEGERESAMIVQEGERLHDELHVVAIVQLNHRLGPLCP